MAKKTEQEKLIGKLEIFLAQMVHDETVLGKKMAGAVAPVVECLHRGETVMAVLEAEANGLDKRILGEMRRVFDVRL